MTPAARGRFDSVADAWQEIIEDPDGYWAAFDRRYGFRAGVGRDQWPGITEPPGSVTLDLTGAYAGGPAVFQAARLAVDQVVLLAFTRVMPAEGWLVALDWQHPTYRFWPHRQALRPQPWRVEPFPDGDYHALVTEDLGEGTFGHPWERTLCVFGERLVAVLVPMLATWLPVLRQADPQ